MTDHSEQLPNAEAELLAKPPSKLRRSLLSLGLSATCIFVGYGFYQMNHHDWLNAIFFTVGLSGIMLSVLRQSKTPKKLSPNDDSTKIE